MSHVTRHTSHLNTEFHCPFRRHERQHSPLHATNHCVYTMTILCSKMRLDHAKASFHTSHVTRHTSHVTHHTSHITRHTLHVNRYWSHVTSRAFGQSLIGEVGNINRRRICCCCCCCCCCCISPGTFPKIVFNLLNSLRNTSTASFAPRLLL